MSVEVSTYEQEIVLVWVRCFFTVHFLSFDTFLAADFIESTDLRSCFVAGASSGVQVCTY